MIRRKKLKGIALAFGFATLTLFQQAALADSVAKVDGNQAVLENDFVKVLFSLDKGTYSVIDKRDNTVNAKDVFFSINDWVSSKGFSFKASAKDINDEFGEGVVLSVLSNADKDVVIGLNISLYDNDGMLALENAVKTTKDIVVKKFSPMQGQVFASEKDFKDFKILGGEAGEYDTYVVTEKDFPKTTYAPREDLTTKVHIVDSRYETHSNILFTFGERGKKKSLVYGGLSYNEFVKKVAIKRLNKSTFSIELNADDPTGKLVDANTSYAFAKDRFYFDFSESNRFKALEDYGFALKKANNVRLDTHTLTSLNFWYCAHARYGGGEFKNNSTGSIDALKKVVDTGFLRYGALGVRLEPDSYARPNNQQGWWDDEHFRRSYGKDGAHTGGQLLPPLDSIEKWGNAVKAEGGVPMIYSQTGKRSGDYAETYPSHMLFNKAKAVKKYNNKYYGGTSDNEWTYDFTDEGFIGHMQDVYANYAKGGLIGVKFDYPDTAWAYEGGFEDKYATTTSAYRNVFALAREGLGWDSDIHERIPRHGDVTLGISTSQRVERDTDRFFPTFAKRCALRWYKNRVVIKYVVDVINPEHSFPYNADGSRAFYTMTYLTQARVEIGKYIDEMSEAHRYELTRITPLYSNLERSAKPIDGFGRDYPQIYDLEINKDWHQVVFYNTKIEKNLKKVAALYNKFPKEPKHDELIIAHEKLIKTRAYDLVKKDKDSHKIRYRTEWPTSYPYTNVINKVGLLPNTVSVVLSDADEDGGLGLDKNKSYYVYDFWNKNFVGKFKGSDTLSQDLREGEARMMSIHAVQNNPQFISTDRHILQGYVDMIVLPTWDSKTKTLSGTSAVIGQDPYKVIIALNGSKISKVEANAKAEIKVIDEQNGLAEMTLNVEENSDVKWTISF